MEITMTPWSGGKTTMQSFQMFGNLQNASYQSQLLQHHWREYSVQLQTIIDKKRARITADNAEILMFLRGNKTLVNWDA